MEVEAFVPLGTLPIGLCVARVDLQIAGQQFAHGRALEESGFLARVLTALNLLTTRLSIETASNNSLKFFQKLVRHAVTAPLRQQ